MALPTISIIGMGNVGSALFKACRAADYKIHTLYNRSESELASVHTGMPVHLKELGDLTFITVSDQALGSVAESLSDLPGEWEGKCFVHCSGTLSSDVLNSLQNHGANIASFHPMMSVKTDLSSFKNIYFDGEGDEICLSMLNELAGRLGARFMEVDAADRKFLHAASVVASNYLVTLAEVASKIGERSGQQKSEVLKAMLPLMKSTLRNLQSGEPREALTGPIARGEKEVIEKHLSFLGKNEDDGEVYRLLGRLTLGLVDEKTRKKLSALFEDEK
ncbi:Rossmann-like and DUF2520 domain-containing protein [Balneola sp. MJW-20]|uniref:Rossmann-like and DUF2520 domain-containing protein n=1 Tax=Gracilimonas aurantiaca TaxID=3234185 RepID=UPI0034672455